MNRKFSIIEFDEGRVKSRIDLTTEKEIEKFDYLLYKFFKELGELK